MTRRSPRPTARCLCASCGKRFSSNAAFDAHRAFQEGHKGDWAFRVCLSPDDVNGFESIEGVCRLTGETIEGVQIWGLAGHADRARSVFRKRERKAKERAASTSQSIRGNAERLVTPSTSAASPEVIRG